MKNIRLAESTNLLYSTILRDQVFLTGLTQDYTIRIWIDETRSYHDIDIVDTSLSPLLYQLFLVDGTTLSLPPGRWTYQMFNDGTGSEVVETGILFIQ